MSDRHAETIRAAIEKSGRSRYKIAKLAGMDQSALRRFMAGLDIRLSTAGKLLDALGLEVKPKGKK